MSVRDLHVDSGDVRLAVRDYGGVGPPVLLLHGLSSNVHIWDLVAGRLTSRFRLVAYDQRGHGRSGRDEDYGFSALVGDAEAVAEALVLDRPLVVGHSWGASVALHFAAVHPETVGVVGVDGGVIDMQDMGMDWEQTAELLRPPELAGPPDDLLARVRAEQSVLPWEVAEPVFRRSFPVGEDGVMRRQLSIDDHMRIVRAMWEERLHATYESVACPVMLVLASGLGEDDRERGFVEVKREGARRLHERFPDVRVEWLPSVHDVPLLHPDELAGLIERFAAGH